MPRSQGTSRKGKPKKNERAAGMGRALEKAQQKRFKPKANGSASHLGGMAKAQNTTNIGIDEFDAEKNKMKSVLEMDSLTDFLGQAEMAGKEFTSERERFVVLDAVGESVDSVGLDHNTKNLSKEKFEFNELSVPRRPQWTKETSAEELQYMENQAFLEWRRKIADQEELLYQQKNASGGQSQKIKNSTVTPFEKNLEVWRQLWRVMERSSCLIQIVDARHPLFYFSHDMRKYAEEELGKPMLLVVNKSDYLSEKQRQHWHQYFDQLGINHIFFSAYQEQKVLDEFHQNEDNNPEDLFTEEKTTDDEEEIEELMNNDRTRLLTRRQLLSFLSKFAHSKDCKPSPVTQRIEIGTIGFPNVGKSSIINVLIGNSKHTHNMVRVGVAAQPGKTKHFQTIFLENTELMLCDCPGLVFPSFVSSTADLIAAGVFPLSQTREHQSLDVIRLILERIPSYILEIFYVINLSKFKPGTLTAEGFLDTLCLTRKMLNASSGTPDHQRASRMVIMDYLSGRLLYCHPPPPQDVSETFLSEEEFEKETIVTLFQHTKKLQEKLQDVRETDTDNIAKKVDPSGENQSHSSKEGDGDDDDDDEEEVEGRKNTFEHFDEDDLDILDILEDYDNPDEGGTLLKKEKKDKSTGKAHKKHYNKPVGKKHGKKGRKHRNKDPYGCHAETTTTDHIRMGAIASGKYASGEYTRPNSYPSNVVKR